jgi:hypothetical protein
VQRRCIAGEKMFAMYASDEEFTSMMDNELEKLNTKTK